MTSVRYKLIIALLAAAAAPLGGQQRTLDRGVLLIMRGDEVIGREEFAVQLGTTAAGPGYTVASTALYPPYRPEQSLTSVIEFGADSFPVVARFEVGNGQSLQVIAGFGPRRITVRRGSSTTESAREYPARERPYVVDDSVFASFAVRPPAVAEPARAIALDGVLGETLTIRYRGPAETHIGDRTLDLDLVVVTVGGETVSAWYDTEGRLQKLEWPQRGVRVVREDAMRE